MKKLLVGVGLGILLSATLGAFDQRPVVNIDPGRHQFLAAAQNLAAQAWDNVVSAQNANEFDLAGHAARAKTLLVQVNSELKQAALTANTH